MKPYGGRIIKCRIKLRKTVNLICAYAPTALQTENVRDTFYVQLSNAVAECPKSELKAIGRDFNARLLEPTVEEEGRVIGL